MTWATGAWAEEPWASEPSAGGAPPTFIASWAYRRARIIGAGVYDMYPKNAASPERLAVGAVVQISDGAVQTSGVSIKVKPQGGAAGAGGGTTSYEEGIVEYLPTQAETNYSSFEVIAYKTGCIPATITVVTTASATAGRVVLSGETHTSAVIPTVTTLTNLPAITANWLTAAGTAADFTTEVQSGLATAADLATVAGYVDTEVAAIKAKTDLIPAAPAAVGDIPTAVQNADALLGRNVSGGSSTGRTVKQAFHFIRNKWVVAAGTLTVYDTDDTTSSWTSAVTGTAGADPITSVDPS